MCKETKALIFLVSAGLMLIAALDMPYGYYNFLKVLVSCVCAFGIFTHQDNKPIIVLFMVLIILFNPILPVYLFDKKQWIYIDLFMMGLFFERSIYFYMQKEEE